MIFGVNRVDCLALAPAPGGDVPARCNMRGCQTRAWVIAGRWPRMLMCEIHAFESFVGDFLSALERRREIDYDVREAARG